MFGFDVLLDEQLRPLVLELNSQPNITDYNMKRRLAEEGLLAARADQCRSSNEPTSRADGPLNSGYSGTYYRRIVPSPLFEEARSLIGVPIDSCSGAQPRGEAKGRNYSEK